MKTCTKCKNKLQDYLFMPSGECVKCTDIFKLREVYGGQMAFQLTRQAKEWRVKRGGKA